MHGYLVGLVADGIKILPLVAPQLREQGAETRYPRTLGMKLWNADRKIKPCEGAPGLPGVLTKLANQRAEIAHKLGSEGGVTPISAQGRPGTTPLFLVAPPISVIDHGRLGGLWHVCSIPIAGISPG